MLPTTGIRPALSDTFAGQRILLTGVTGFLAKVWLSSVLCELPEIGCVTLLVRSKSGASPRERVEHMLNTSPVFRPLREKYGDTASEFFSHRIEVVEGDVCRPRLGLKPEVLRRISAEVDAVVHCAGLTDFEPDPMQALRINTRGTKHAADVAARLRHPRLVVISTAFVAGDTSGEVAEQLHPGRSPNGTVFDVREEMRELARACEATNASSLATRPDRIAIGLERARALGWPNIYTYTKGLAEHLIGSRKDVQWTLVRPSIVECALNFPFPGWNEGLNTAGPLAWLISTAFHRLPAGSDHRFDMIPVDFAANGMTLATAAMLRDEAAPVYHLGTSDCNPVTFERIIDLHGLAMRRNIRRDPHASLYERAIVQHLDPIPVAWHDQGWLEPGKLKRVVKRLRDTIQDLKSEDLLPDAVDNLVGETLRSRLSRVEKPLGRTQLNLGRIQQMLELYRPFIHDNNYIFRTDRIRSETALLTDRDRDRLGFRPERLDWRHYWMDVELEGLKEWCFPLMNGKRPAEDSPAVSPIRLHDLPQPLEKSA